MYYVTTSVWQEGAAYSWTAGVVLLKKEWSILAVPSIAQPGTRKKTEMQAGIKFYKIPI